MRPHLLVATLFAGFVLADAAVAEQMAGSIADRDRLAAHPNDQIAPVPGSILTRSMRLRRLRFAPAPWPNIGASHDLTKSTSFDGADFVR